MIICKIIRSHQCKTLLRFKNPSGTPSAIPHSSSSNSVQPSYRVSVSFRPFSFLAHFQSRECAEPITPQDVGKEKEKVKKSLGVYFKEAVGLLEKIPEDNETGFEGEDENAELKNKLRKLEEELRLSVENLENTKQKEEKGTNRVRQLLKNVSPVEIGSTEGKKPGGLSLSSFFASRVGVGRDREMEKKESKVDREREKKELKVESSSVYKRLSPDMEKFVIHLYQKGYFKDSNFLPRNRFDITCFENSYGKDYVRYAAEQFGRDNRPVSKWLSGSDLKKVASFGCPSLGKKVVFSAKGLRRFFGIHENTVCDKCALKQSCKFVNQSAGKVAENNLDLAVVMRVIPMYALELVPPQLVVPEEIKDSASRLLKEAVNLSETLT